MVNIESVNCIRLNYSEFVRLQFSQECIKQPEKCLEEVSINNLLEHFTLSIDECNTLFGKLAKKLLENDTNVRQLFFRLIKFSDEFLFK